VIVRIMGEGQWRVDDDEAARLNELDDGVFEAVEAGDEAALAEALARLAEAVRSSGKPLAVEDLAPSDAIVPPDDLTLDEARRLLGDEGFIPNLPVSS
jgi:PspA-Associated protein